MKSAAVFFLLTSLLMFSSITHAADPFYPQPTTEQIRALSQIDYGADAAAVQRLNEAVFAVYHYNNDAVFCAKMEQFLVDELATGAGTSRYRTMLAQMVEATGVQNHHDRFARLAAAEADEAVRSRLLEAIAHLKRSTSLTRTETALAIPSAKPEAVRDQARVIDYLASHASTPMPVWLTLENLDDSMKPRLVYALMARDETGRVIASLNANTPALALAAGYAFSRAGVREHSLEQLLSYAPLLDKEQTAQMAVYIAQAPMTDRADKLAASLGSKNAMESTLAAAALAQMDLSKFSRRFLAGYDAANNDEKRVMLKVCESLSDEYAFCEIARRLPTEADAGLRTAMQRALLRISQTIFTTPMFESVVDAYAGDTAVKTFWLRFASLQGDVQAVAFCKRAYADGLQGDAIKTLGSWKTPLAIDALVTLAKQTTDARERLLAQTSLVSLMERVGVQKSALDYLQANAARDDIAAAALRLAAEPKTK